MANFLLALPTGFWARIIFILQNYGVSLLKGAGTTLLIAVVGTLIGCVIGFIVGLVQTIPSDPSGNIVKRIVLRIVKIILRIYVEVFRGTPMMVQAMFLHYGAMLVFNLHMSMWTSAFVIVSINTGAYMAETVRGGIFSVPLSQTEGAKAIGMTHFQTMLYVVLPQALRNIMPQIGNNLIINIKDTCVLSCIGVVELFYASKSVAGTYYTYFETFTITMAMYLIMTLFFSWLLRVFEKRMDGPAEYDLATTDTLAYTSGTLTMPATGHVDDRRLTDEHE